jgi:uncharacterized protein (TIGR02466 family)
MRLEWIVFREGQSVLKLAHIQMLFPTPLVTLQVEEADELNRDLLEEIDARRRAEPGETRSNRQGWHSAYDLFRRKEKAHARLAAIIRQAVEQTTRQLAPTAPLDALDMECEGWINVNPTGAYNTPHDHPGNLWSGTYYVATPEAPDGSDSSGRIEFIDGRSGLADNFVKAPFTASKCGVGPKPGMLLLFPANLLHWVHPNLAAGERVTVAFNARFNRRPQRAGRPRR